MKIIRLISNNESEADFTNTFNSPIFIDEDSKIGLLNLSLVLEDKNIVVTNDNNKFNFKTKSSGATKTVTLPVGNYNYKELEDMLMISFNNVLDANDAGFMWLPKIVDNIVNLQWSTSTNNIVNFTNKENLTGDNTNGYIKTGGSNVNWNGWAISNTPLTEGVGGCQFIVKAYQPNTNFIVGIADEIKEKGETLEPSNFRLGLVSVGDKYSIIDNNVVYQTTNVNVQGNDLLVFKLIKGEYSIEINGNVVYTSPKTNYDTNYFIATSFLENNTTTAISGIKAYFNPFYKQTIDGITYNDILPQNLENNVIEYNGLGAPPATRIVTLTFPNIDTANLLGFKTLNYRKQLNTGAFIGQTKLDDLHLPSSLIVEIPNLDINSYDGLVSRRQNIIAVIPSLQQEGLNMIYQNNTPIMVDIKNNQITNLNHLRVRILSIANKPIKVKENVSLTLLLN